MKNFAIHKKVKDVDLKIVAEGTYFNGSRYNVCVSKVCVNDKEYLIKDKDEYSFISTCIDYKPDRIYLVDYGKNVSKIIQKIFNLKVHTKLIVSEEYYNEINDNLEAIIDEARLEYDKTVLEADSNSSIHIYLFRGTLTVSESHRGFKSFKLEELLSKLNSYSTKLEELADEKYIVYEEHMDPYLEIPFTEIDEVIKKASAKVEFQRKELIQKQITKDDRLKDLLKKAMDTGKEQVIERWSEPCDDPKEDCEVDIVEEVMCPDKEIRYRRYHTW